MAVVGLALAIATVTVHKHSTSLILIGYWWLGVIVILSCLIAHLVGRRYTDQPMASGRLLAIIPAYNEDPESLRRCVLSMLQQTRPPDAIHVIDDGSKEPVVPSVQAPNVYWHRQENTGKRGAQVTVLRMYEPGTWDYVLTVDSDSELDPAAMDAGTAGVAIEQMLRAMSTPQIQAATGMIYIRNYDQNWLTRAADLDIGCSCIQMRASRSMLGALETTSGALALYRASILFDNIDAYAIECGTGDDRWLALRALERGEVVAVAEATVRTDMPETLRKTRSQRQRWARSWFWMLPFVLTRLSFKQIISPVFGMTQLVIAPLIMFWALMATVLGFQSRMQHWMVVAMYVGAYVTVRWALSALYLLERPDMSRGQKVYSFFIGTFTTIMLNAFFLTPIRYWALLRLNDAQWSNRSTSGAHRLAGRPSYIKARPVKDVGLDLINV